MTVSVRKMFLDFQGVTKHRVPKIEHPLIVQLFVIVRRQDVRYRQRSVRQRSVRQRSGRQRSGRQAQRPSTQWSSA